MSENRLVFLKNAFPELKLQFADDFSNAVIVNPNYDENITVYDDEYEYIVCFSFQHCHFDDEDDIIEWIHSIIFNNTLAIEFFKNEQRCFGGEIDAKELQYLTYEKLERFTGYYGTAKLLDVADSFKIRGWDNKNNLDCTIIREENGNITINKTFVDVV